MTIPALMPAHSIFTIVPLASKRQILTRILSTLLPDETLPATILSRTPGNLYVDQDSCPVQLFATLADILNS